MNSSTGFKKRGLLRPPSGMRQKQRQREYLKVFDISQTQPMIANQVRNQIIRIQEQINELDKDKKIRSGQVSSLQKSYILTFKKWLSQSSMIHDKQDDQIKVLKYMGVDSYEAGFRKLWKVVSSLDHIVTKMTQLQIVQLLKYDQIFDQLSKDSQKSSLILSTLSKTGFTPGTFQVGQVALERNKDLYSLLIQSKRKAGSSFITNTDRQTYKKSQTNQLIAQLQKQNSKLGQLFLQLERQKENNQMLLRQLKSKEETIKINGNVSNNVAKLGTVGQNMPSNNPNEVFKQLQERYTERLAHLATQISRLESSLSEQKVSASSVQSRLKMAQNQLKQKDQDKAIKAKPGSYEEASLQQMQKMRKGFERKIQKLLEQFGLKEKQMRKKQIQYRNENEKIKWEKNLLLKKFDTLEQVKAN